MDPKPDRSQSIREGLRAAGEQGMAALRAAAAGEPPPGTAPATPAPAPAHGTPPAGMANPMQAGAPAPANPAPQPQAQPQPQPQPEPQTQPALEPAPAPADASGGEPTPEFAEIALPQHLHQEGFERLQVPKENAPVLEALIRSARSGDQVQAERVALQQEHAANVQRFQDASASLAADPFGTFARIAAATGTPPEEIEETAQLFFLQDPARLERLRATLEEVSQSDAQLRAAVAQREAALQTRRQRAQNTLHYQRTEQQWCNQMEARIAKGIESIPEQRREFAYRNIATTVNAWLQQRGFQRITDAEIDALVSQWTGYFPANGQATAQAQGEELMRQQAAQRATALRVMPAGAAAAPQEPSGGPTKPKAGATLDDIAQLLRTGVAPS